MRLPEYPALRRASSSRTAARRTFIAVVVGSGALLFPCALRAQAPGLFETFASRKESTSDALDLRRPSRVELLRHGRLATVTVHARE
jgi:hypothetical protein